MSPLFLTKLALALVAAPHAPTTVASTALAAAPYAATATWMSVSRDPADSLYKAARDALNNGDYDRAAQLFGQVGKKFPQSALLPDAMYYEAFALYRNGKSEDLQRARTLLATLGTRFPDYVKRSDTATLSTRICGELAQRGDAGCAATIATQVKGAEGAAPKIAGTCPDENDDERVAALNALLQMDAASAEPILEKVLARRDACSATLRRKAVFLVSQKSSPQAVDVLLKVARTDPDPEVAEQAVFWLSQIPGERSLTVLKDLLANSPSSGIREKAIFAISQNRSAQARQILHDYAQNASAPPELREKAIFWIGQDKSGDNVSFLKSLYSRLTDQDLKEKVLFSVSQRHEGDNLAWLLQVAQNRNENIEMRKKALFWAGQSGVSIDQLSRMYDSMTDNDLREQMIFVLSQRREPAAMDKLISIARTDRNPAARQKALFWLGQSHDPRAMKVLAEVIDK